MSIGPAWLHCAKVLLREAQADPHSGDVLFRRAISTAYYALFHTLTAAGAEAFASGGPALSHKAARAFSHAGMRKVCDAYIRSPHPFPDLLPADPHLVGIAQAFTVLQEGRHSADYDLATLFDSREATRLVSSAEAAYAAFDAIRTASATKTFLTALLLADRWTRRG